MAKVRYYLISALLISVIGFVESIVVAKTYATKHNYAVSPNRELVALGVANTFGSAVNDSTGARTQVAGFVTGIIIFVAIVALLPLFYSPAQSFAAVKLIELHDVEFILRLRAWKDLGLLLMTFLSTLLISIEVGTLISIGTSLLLVIKHTTKTRIVVLGRALVVDPKSGELKTKFRSITETGQVEPIEGCLVIRIEEGLFFGNTGQLKDRLKRVEMYGELGVHPGEMPRPRDATAIAEEEGRKTLPATWEATTHVQGVIFDIGAMNGIDATATQILLEIVETYHNRNIVVCFVKLRDSCKPLFMRSGLWLVGMEHFFDKIRDALEYLRETSHVEDSGLPDFSQTESANSSDADVGMGIPLDLLVGHFARSLLHIWLG
ncbi:hypothetical protein BC829DRAFT_422437 [Chytridium lagenaria]|nr:hypothetical protein BC829DRAFT_422437 [Chytridium lagenaria]